MRSLVFDALTAADLRQLRGALERILARIEASA
jgi:hypothetical protein